MEGAAQLPASGAPSFGQMLQQAVGSTVQSQQNAEALSIAAANGDPNISIQSVIQAVSEAELTLQTMVTVRDRAVEAYQEILRMPI